jgi:hypothetical protein
VIGGRVVGGIGHRTAQHLVFGSLHEPEHVSSLDQGTTDYAGLGRVRDRGAVSLEPDVDPQ